MSQNFSARTVHVLPLKSIQSEDFSFFPKSWGNLVSGIHSLGSDVTLPEAFVIKSSFFDSLISENTSNSNAKQKIKDLTRRLNGADQKTKKTVLHELENIVLKTSFSKEFEKEVLSVFKKVCGNSYKQVIKISASIFSENHTFSTGSTLFTPLKKESDLFRSIKQAFAFFYSKEVEDESQNLGFEYPSLHISLMFEKVGETNLHGKILPFEPKTGFEKVFFLTSSYGRYTTKKNEDKNDTFLISKSALQNNKLAIIKRNLGEKSFSFERESQGTLKRISVPVSQRNVFSLSETDLVLLSKAALHFQNIFGSCEIDWEKNGKKFIFFPPKFLQIPNVLSCIEKYILQNKTKPLFRGTQLGNKIVTGKIRIVEKIKDVDSFQSDEILVVRNVFFELFGCISKCGALLIDKKQSESSIVLEAREREIPVFLFSSDEILKLLRNGKRVTLAEGALYEGALPFEVKKEIQPKSKKSKTKIMMNIENPENAFHLQKKQVDGVGVVRFESFFAHAVPFHPLAIINYPKLKDKNAKKQIEQLTRGYENKKEYAIEKLSESIGSVALAFAPSPVTVRLSDFASSELSSFFGATEFKKVQPLHLFNSDAKDDLTVQYREAFALQCKAIQKVRDEMGLNNVVVMVPFCPTPEQGEEVIRLMKECGLERGKNGLQIHGMCEIPANFILAQEFIKIFDGFSIDINGLEESIGTKKTFRNHSVEAAVESLVQDVIYAAHRNNKYISFSSSRTEGVEKFSEFLIRKGIDSLSFAPDMVDNMKIHALELEKTLGRRGDKTHPGFLSLVLGVGALAATLIGMGSGCSETLNTKITQKDVSEYLPPIKIREEMQKKFEQQLEKLTEVKWVSVEESGFANFSFEYPITWNLNHGEERISIVGPNTSSTINFFVIHESMLTGVTTTQRRIDGNESFHATNIEVNGVFIANHIEIPLKDNKIFVIDGGGDEFEKMVQSLKFLSKRE